MFDKLETVVNYYSHLQESLKLIPNIIHNSYRNLILVNVNTPFVTNLIYNHLKIQGIKYKELLSSDFNTHKTLGNFLRYNINRYERSLIINEDESDVLILDFVRELSEVYSCTSDIVDEININRDLFTLVYDSIIILMPPTICYGIMTHAVDFWSCVDAYIDTSKWFCSPITLPIVKVRIYSNFNSNLFLIHRNKENNYSEFINLKEEISQVKIFTPSKFNSLLYKIRTLSNKIYEYELMNFFINIMSSAKVDKIQYLKRVNCFRELFMSLEESLPYVDVRIMLAEFFYNCGEFNDAIECYKKAVIILEEMWDEDLKKNTVASFLRCNVSVCKYMDNRKHSPYELISELKERINGIENDVLTNEFTKTYLVIINATLHHHTYAQHKDILDNLMTIDTYTLPMLDLTEPFKGLLIWEQFILADFQPQSLTSNSILTNILVNIQRMVYYFCRGNYRKSREAYAVVKSLSESYGYIEIYKIVRIFRNNMISIYEKVK